MNSNVVEKIKTPVTWLSKVATFLKEVRIQIKKISWPTPAQALRYTLVVLAASLIFALFLGGVDFLFSTLLTKVILR